MAHPTRPAGLLASLLAALLLGVSAADAQEITLLAAGDMEWSRAVKPPPAFLYEPTDSVEIAVRGVTRPRAWEDVPYLNLPESLEAIRRRFDEPLETERSHHVAAIQYGLEFSSVTEDVRHPFQRTRPLFREADVAFANLEMPLSLRARHTGAFRGHPAFADALRWAGVDVVSTANNHAFDAGETGLLDTVDALAEAGVGSIGTGRTLEDARRPVIIEREGIRLAFLGYARAVNVLGSAGFAQPDRSGVMPLDPILIKEDIQQVRDQVDYVVLSFHWAIENAKQTHPDARAFAYEMLDAGADVILGHHPHVPRGVEVRDGKVIFYSLGNFTFGHNHTYWQDGYVGRLTMTPHRITQVEILPLAGEGMDMAQPFLLEGERARRLLREVQALTAELGTRMEIRGDVGVVRP